MYYAAQLYVFLLRSDMPHVCVSSRRTTSHASGISSNVIAASADVHPSPASTTQDTKSDFTITFYADVHTSRAAQNAMDTGSDLDTITVSDEAHLTSAPNGSTDTESDFDIISFW